MKQSRRSSWLIGAILGSLCACVAASHANAAPANEFQDGMLARGEVIGSELVLRWRFFSPLPHPLDSIMASVHGRPLGVPRIQPYPRSGDRTLAAFLVDTGGRARASEITNDSATILALMAQLRSYQDGLVITYGQDAAMLAAKSGQAADLVDAILSLGPEEEKSFRDKAILKSLDIMAAASVSRRVLFVLTDGHSDEQPRVDQVVAAAQRAGTMVTFIVAHSLGLRSVDPEPIATIAARTGGEVVTAKTLDAFLRNPFAMVDSGGEANLPLDRGFVLPWEFGSNIDVRMNYGARSLALVIPALLPPANMPQIVAALRAEPNRLLPTGIVAVAIVLAAIWTWRWRRRAAATHRARGGEREPRSVPLATLEDVEMGTLYPVTAPLVRIGRNKENDVVLDEVSVGRFHAILQQIGDSSFSIVDQSSANGTLINNKKIETATLASGDLITLGSKVLRFHSGALVAGRPGTG